MKKLLLVLVVFGVITGCGDDDDGGIPGVQIPPRLLSEVAPENDEEIQEFLQTHFYNYEDFQEPIAPDFDFKIVIDKIEGENADKTPLSQQVVSEVINVSSSQLLGLTEEETDVPHTFYYLVAREGEGIRPTVADSVLMRLEGRLLDGTAFESVTDFSWQLLPTQVRGFYNSVAKVNSGTVSGIVENPDGTTEISNRGIGLMIIPSGLGFFNLPRSEIIPRYAPLIFTFESGLFVENTDSDLDGVPNILEDINENEFFFDDNTDEELELELGFGLQADFQDIDDDGDGVLTRTEISDADGNIITPYPDSNNDGTPDYLDPDIQRDPNG